MTEKQTAIEWLYNLSKQRELDKFDLEQAKQMEKQQMQDFGARCCLMTKQKNEWTLEQLYNKTYGSKGSDEVNKMTLRHALLILESHQKWRMGDEFTQATEPKVLTEAINTILQYHVGSTTALIDQIPDVRNMVSSQTEISDEEIEKWAEKYGFRVPYDGSNNFYDNEAIKHYINGAKMYREQLKQRQ